MRGDNLKEYYKTHKRERKGKTLEEIFGKEKARNMKIKISETQKKQYSEGRIHPMLGKHHSIESLQKLSQSLIGRKAWNKGKRLHYPVWNKGTAIRIGRRKTKTVNGQKIDVSHFNWMIHNNFYRIPQGFVIHHLNGNREDNIKENLQLLPDLFHRRFHQELSRRISIDSGRIKWL